MGTNWTPGEWRVDGGALVEDAQGNCICMMPTLSFSGAAQVEFDWRPNARLIGAAPDLYEALEALTERCEYDHLRRLAYTALAKARGDV